MNPLPNRPLLNNPSMPLSLPNVPSFDQMPYNGRPRKILPSEAGSNLLNGINIMTGPSSAPASTGAQMQPLERSNPLGSGILQQHVPGAPMQSTSQQQQQQQSPAGPSQPPPSLSDTQNEREREPDSEPRQLTAIFRPEPDWKERLRQSHEASEQARLARESQMEEEELKEDEGDVDDEENVETEGEGSKMWKTKRTLRKYVSSAPPPFDVFKVPQSFGRCSSARFPSNGIMSCNWRRRLYSQDMAHGRRQSNIFNVRPPEPIPVDWY